MERDRSEEPLERLSGAAFERAYIRRIVEHHRTALAMAGAVVDVAPHAAVREAARATIAEQTREIAMLTGWLAAWYGEQVGEGAAEPAERTPGLKGGDAEAAERDFLRQMPEHHASAIAMGELALAKATHEELKDQARRMIASQRNSRDRFAAWLKAWYGEDVSD